MDACKVIPEGTFLIMLKRNIIGKGTKQTALLSGLQITETAITRANECYPRPVNITGLTDLIKNKGMSHLPHKYRVLHEKRCYT